jgi:acyl carrier protein
VKTKILVPTNCVRLVTDYLEIDVNLVVDEAHLSKDLGVDCLDQIESLIMIEDKFESVQFLDGTAIDLVGDLIRYIEMKSQKIKHFFAERRLHTHRARRAVLT